MSDLSSNYCPASAHGIHCLDTVEIAGEKFSTAVLPEGLRLEKELGVILAGNLTARRVCLDDFVCHPRSIITPGGDYLLMHPAGPMHYVWAGRGKMANRMYQYRSSDGGCSWTPGAVAWEVPYSMHASVPFIPTGSSRIYAFGTEPVVEFHDGTENAPIGYRFSDDDGRTWSPAQIIRPQNDPNFCGMSAMRMCETRSGAWLVGAHASHWTADEAGEHVVTHQYLLRSADRGETWTVLPAARPNGWQCPGTCRMDEARPILLPDGQILLMARTPEGRLWQSRSDDDGLTWSAFEPTPLVHLDAPPMLFMLADGKTLVAFFHNKRRPADGGAHIFAHEARVELWCALSTDGSRTWSEPRLVAVNACEPAVLNGWGGVTPMVSYADLLVDGDQLELFIDHQMRQVIHVRLTRQDLDCLPVRSDLVDSQP